jgi:hypothetical protein
VLALVALLGCKKPEPEATPCALDLAVSGDGVVATDDACASVELGPRALGDGDLAVSLAEVDGAVVATVTSASGGTLRAVVLQGAVSVEGEGPKRWWRQGYQSWSWSGVVEPTPAELDSDGLPVVGGDGNALAVIDETPWTSWWVGLLGRTDGASVAVGALSATKTKVWAALDGDELYVVWGGRGEAIEVPAGGSVELDPIWIGADRDANALLEAYAAEVADRAGVSATGVPPTGFGTWYQYYSAVTEEDVRRDLALATATWAGREDLGPGAVFQIDDGWQVRWGDWTAGDDFPSGMAAITADIRAAGFVPGVWMAPFYVSRESATYAAHPDWWVRDESGEELSFTNLGTGDYAVIDATHPEAGPWMAAQVRARVDEGFGYLKLDFLYAGAQEGVRYEDVTGAEAYRRAMELLREASGDSWVLACGAPMLPSVGFFESYRSGADIAFEVDPDPRQAYVRWQARATAARGWQNGAWWWIDPDAVMVRAPFTDVQATGSAVAQAVSGGTWLLGDGLDGLPDDRLALALHPDLVATRGQRVRPVRPLDFVSGIDPSPAGELIQNDDRAPVAWVFADGTTALLNLSDVPVEVDSPGGTEVLSGATSEGGERTLEPGQGELWVP